MQNAMIVCDSAVNETAVTRRALLEFSLVCSPSHPLPAKHLPGNKLYSQRSLREFARS